jgi:DEAD/DEAH box helicase domain-containing protein
VRGIYADFRERGEGLVYLEGQASAWCTIRAVADLDRILSTIEPLAAKAGLIVRERAFREERRARMQPLPDALDVRVRAAITAGLPGGVYAHQADAVAAGLGGEDVGLATATASGKSLVFMAIATHHLVRDARATTLAIYPTRALIAAQLEKWHALLAPLGEEAQIIDGGVRPMAAREAILRRCRVVLMTPDVVHAWLLPSAGQPVVGRFLGGLRVLIADEAHAYEGVFGTNVAYLFRRIAAAAPSFRLIASTATIADPAGHLRSLTGRTCRVFAENDDGSARPARATLLADGGKATDALVGFLRALAQDGSLRFLACADSRKMVETLVARLRRGDRDADDDDAGDAIADRVLPYRSGYEDDDRREIQGALKAGKLRGVVPSSALELAPMPVG